MKTSSGVPVVIEDFEADEGKTKGVRLAYFHEGETGFMVVFYAPTEVFEEWKPMVDYLLARSRSSARQWASERFLSPEVVDGTNCGVGTSLYLRPRFQTGSGQMGRSGTH